MQPNRGPIYELSIVVGSGSVAALRERLKDYRREHAGDAGIVDLRLLESTDPPLLTLQIAFETNEVLDEFLSGRASALEASVEDAAGDNRTSSRILHEQDDSALPPDSTCPNCGTALRGQYCGQCGQRARSRLISLWELIRDAFGDLFELDSRLWQTLIPMLLRPGQLTADYLKGKRARFMPPFRMYLVLSLLFFVVAFFDPNKDLALFYAEPTEAPEAATGPAAAAEPNIDQEETSEADGPKFNISFGDDEAGTSDNDDCEMDEDTIQTMPVWMQQRLTPNRLKHICEQTIADDGEQLKENMLDIIPAALIILLPLMAFVLKLLYPLARRYYVEHVLFFVHFHAFFFLILSLQIVWSRLITTLGLADVVRVIPILLSAVYIPVYLFKAMRRVYGQGFWLTMMKYILLFVSYVAGFGAMLLGALAIAAFSI